MAMVGGILWFNAVLIKDIPRLDTDFHKITQCTPDP